MTLQTENGAPSFYTFPRFHPRRNALLYGAVLSLIAFCAVTLIFNYGIREKLWTYDSGGLNSGASVSESVSDSFSQSAVPTTIRAVTLSESVLHSLEGTYFSVEVNRIYSLTIDKRQIYWQIGGEEKINLVPISDDTLYAGEGHLIKFSTTSAGRVDHLDIYDNGRHIVASRE